MKPLGPSDFLDEQQLARLLGAFDLREVEGRRGFAIVLALYKLGVRKSELCNAHLGDVGIFNQQRTIRVFRNKAQRRRRDRLLVDDELWAAIETYRRHIPEEHASVELEINGVARHGRSTSGVPLFLTNPRNWRPTKKHPGGPRRLSSRSVDLVISAAANRSGLRAEGMRVTPHSLRATAATLMLRRGEDLATVSAFLGHTKIASTEHYLRAMMEDVLRAQAGAITPSRRKPK